MTPRHLLVATLASLGLCLIALGHPAPAPLANPGALLIHVAGDGEPAGEASTEPAAPAVTAAEFEALMTQGRELYIMNCSACHGSNGQGGVGPAHAGNQNLADTQHVLTIIHEGSGFMPQFAGTLKDAQIAAVATYIRNSWGNEFGAITEAESAALR